MKAWCKTAQIALDLLADNHELQVCIHAYDTSFDRHGYLWNTQTREVTRFLQDTILERLIRDGYVGHMHHVPNASAVRCSVWHYRTLGNQWKAVYRLIAEDEDKKAQARRNLERDTIFTTLLDLDTRIHAFDGMAHRSGDADNLVHSLVASREAAYAMLARVRNEDASLTMPGLRNVVY